MSGFSADWLALREPFDARARNPAVLDAATAAFAGYSSLTIVDLACGTGSTMRALAPRFPMHQNWRLVDNDLGLLARAMSLAPSPRATVAGVPLDLDRDLEAALDGPVDLVAASALLDLVSEAWLERFAIEIATRAIPVYIALSYDGRVEFAPSDTLDAAVIAALNAHQRTDKGFGHALGPTAISVAVARFESLGYLVVRGQSDWSIGPNHRDIQLELLAGWAGAARDIGELSLPDAAAWLTRRRAAVSAGRSSMRVGHVDLFGRPTARRWSDRSQSNRTSSPS